MKTIIESILFTKCTECGTIREHRAEVHSTIHFEPLSPIRTWRDEFDDFVQFICGKDYLNFHEAYMDFLKETN